MPIEFHCTQCNRLLRTPDDSVGKQAKCPECGTILTVPATSAAPSPPPEAPRVSESGNPYQTPPLNVSQRPTTAFTGRADMATAASRLAGPSIALMVTAGLCVFLSCIGFAGNIAQMGGVGAPPNANQDQMAFLMFYGTFGIITGIVQLVVDGLIIYGALQMKDLKSYNWALASSIMAMIPCLGSCCVLTLPFGIWAVVVLQDIEVRQAFAANEQGQGLR